jgi:hypothetical protein
MSVNYHPAVSKLQFPCRHKINKRANSHHYTIRGQLYKEAPNVWPLIRLAVEGLLLIVLVLLLFRSYTDGIVFLLIVFWRTTLLRGTCIRSSSRCWSISWYSLDLGQATRHVMLVCLLSLQNLSHAPLELWSNALSPTSLPTSLYH